VRIVLQYFGLNGPALAVELLVLELTLNELPLLLLLGTAERLIVTDLLQIDRSLVVGLRERPELPVVQYLYVLSM
jgi:hypothetical protein